MAEQKVGTVEVRPRDLELLRGLYESRLMKLTHAAAIYFDGSLDAATKRVQKLKRAGLITERPRQARAPSILTLAAGGLELLIREGDLQSYPQLSVPQMRKRAHISEQTLKHELYVMDVKASFYAACRRNPIYEVKHFSTWPLLNEFKAAGPDGNIVRVRPDGFITIEETDSAEDRPYRFFLEMDCGSKNQDTLADHAWSYRDYYFSGGFAVRNGAKRDQFTHFPFRVLFVFLSAERQNNAAERMLLLRNPIGTHSCLTTIDEVNSDPFGPIWITPQEYSRVTRGTEYDPERRRGIVGYSRSAKREQLVEANVRKTSLLE